jgi:hypothetical protein
MRQTFPPLIQVAPQLFPFLHLLLPVPPTLNFLALLILDAIDIFLMDLITLNLTHQLCWKFLKIPLIVPIVEILIIVIFPKFPTVITILIPLFIEVVFLFSSPNDVK